MSRPFELPAPRVRVALLLAWAVSASLLTSWKTLLPLVLAGLLLTVSAGVPLRGLLRRLGWLAYLAGGLFVTLPLTVPGPAVVHVRAGWVELSGSFAGVALATLISLRMLACFLAALALTASTPLPELLHALTGLGVPSFFVQLAGISVRYIAVLREEVQRQLVSRRSRCYQSAGVIWHRQTLRTSAQTVGMALLRAYDRSERIYWAMMSRGYNPEHTASTTEPLTAVQRGAIALALVGAVGLVLLDRRIGGG